LGLKKVRGDYWEIRLSVRNRIIFEFKDDVINFVFVGSHNNKLLEEAKRLTKAKTKKEVVNLSLKELIRKKRREDLADLFGSSIVDITLKDLEKLRKDEF